MGQATTGWTTRSRARWWTRGWRRAWRIYGRRWRGARHGEGAPPGEADGDRGTVRGFVEAGPGGAARGREGQRRMRAVVRADGGRGAVTGADRQRRHGANEGDRGRRNPAGRIGEQAGMNVQRIQQEIRNQKLDGWLFFDHHLRDPLGYRVPGVTAPRTPPRRWYYLIPAEGEPRGLEHRVEPGMTGPLPGERIAYSSWTEQVEGLREITGGLKRVAMQYSPNCAIPYVSMVDAGTVELVRSLGVDVVSSAELIQVFEAVWTPAQLETHLEAGRRVDVVRKTAFEYLQEHLRNGVATTELDVK